MDLTSQIWPEKGQAEPEVWAQGRELLLESEVGTTHIYIRIGITQLILDPRSTSRLSQIWTRNSWGYGTYK